MLLATSQKTNIRPLGIEQARNTGTLLLDVNPLKRPCSAELKSDKRPEILDLTIPDNALCLVWHAQPRMPLRREITPESS